MTASDGTRSSFAEVNGTRLSYEVAGMGQPLTLIHAGIADSGMWDSQFSAFARRYRVVRFDMRGFGRSPKPPEPYTPWDDLHGLLEPVCKAICEGKRAFAGAASSKATVLIPPVFAYCSRLQARFQLYTQALTVPGHRADIFARLLHGREYRHRLCAHSSRDGGRARPGRVGHERLSVRGGRSGRALGRDRGGVRRRRHRAGRRVGDADVG